MDPYFLQTAQNMTEDELDHMLIMTGYQGDVSSLTLLQKQQEVADALEDLTVDTNDENDFSHVK